MKVLSASLFVALGFAAGLVTGRILFWREVENSSAAVSAATKETTARGEQESISARAVGEHHGQALPLTVGDLTTELQRLRKMEPGSDAEIKGWDHLRARLQSTDLGTLAKAMVDSYPSGTSEELLGMVFTELADQKPDEAWQLLMDIKSPQLRQQVGWSVCSTMANKDINKTLALIARIPESRFKMEMRQAALNTLASRDPARAFALEVEHAGDRPDFEPNFWEWVKVDPDAAIRAASTLKGAAFTKAARNLLSALAQRDPQKAWSFAQSLPQHKGDTWEDPRYTTLSSWGATDPEAAVVAALSLSDAELRTQCVAEIASSWADADFPSALSYVLSLQDPDIKAKALAQMTWANHASKPELFAALREHGPVGDSHPSASLMESWARQDPAAAAAALSQLPPSAGLDEATSRFVRGWLSSSSANPTDIFSWVKSLPEKTSAREEAVVTFFQEIGKKDAQSGAMLLASLDAATQPAAYAGLAEGWSSAAPAEAAAWALRLPAESRTEAMAHVVDSWAKHDPMAAAEFALRNDTNGDFVSAVVSQWLPGSPQQATAWVDRLPRGDVRDAGLAKIAEIVSQEDPSAAVLWATRISSELTRSNELLSICRRWIEVDPANARNWIQTSSLSQEAKNSLLSR